MVSIGGSVHQACMKLSWLYFFSSLRFRVCSLSEKREQITIRELWLIFSSATAFALRSICCEWCGGGGDTFVKEGIQLNTGSPLAAMLSTSRIPCFRTICDNFDALWFVRRRKQSRSFPVRVDSFAATIRPGIFPGWLSKFVAIDSDKIRSRSFVDISSGTIFVCIK